VDNEQLLSQLRRTHNAVTTHEQFHSSSNRKFDSINKYAYERLSQSTIAPDIWNRDSNSIQSKESNEQTALNIGEQLNAII
jgi:hypothetical protein